MIGGTNFDIGSESVFPNGIGISSDAGTISFCLQPQWNGSEGADTRLIAAPSAAGTALQIARAGEQLQFTVGNRDSVGSAASTSVTSWKAGERHLVTASWGGERASLYVDGQLVDQQSYQGRVEMSPDTRLQVGSRLAADTPGANGLLSDLQVYHRSLDDGEVAKLASGCQ